PWIRPRISKPMDQLSPALLLKAALGMYVVGGVGSLLLVKRERLANLLGFGAPIGAGLCGLAASLLFLLASAPNPPAAFSLWPPLIPYLHLTVQLDPLG